MDIFKSATPRRITKQSSLIGKMEVRKGHDILFEAFRMAETHNPNMELWMMCTNPFNSPEEEAKEILLCTPRLKLSGIETQ